jgi:hypothetical protein
LASENAHHRKLSRKTVFTTRDLKDLSAVRQSEKDDDSGNGELVFLLELDSWTKTKNELMVFEI